MKKGNKFSIYNRHTFLNIQIVDFHNLVVKTLGKYKTDIKNLKRQVSELKQWDTNKIRLKKEKPHVYEKYAKTHKSQMCTSKDCKHGYRECENAHTAIQLNLTQVKTEKKLLINNLKNTQKKLSKSKALIPWSYPKSGYIEKEKNFVKEYNKRITYKPNKSRSKSKTRLNNMNDVLKQRHNRREASRSKKRDISSKSKNKEKYAGIHAESNEKFIYDDFLTELRIERHFRSKSEKRLPSADIQRFRIKAHEY
jgi:hypothetical protein